MTDSEQLAIAQDVAEQRSKRNWIAITLIMLAAVALAVSFFQPWLSFGTDRRALSGLPAGGVAAFLVGILLVFGAAGAALTLTGPPRRTVAGAGLAMTAALLCTTCYLPVSAQTTVGDGPLDVSAGAGAIIAGLAVALLGGALITLMSRIVVETPEGPRSVD